MDLSEVNKFETKQSSALQWFIAELRKQDSKFIFQHSRRSWGCFIGAVKVPVFPQISAAYLSMEKAICQELEVTEHQNWHACALSKVAIQNGVLDKTSFSSSVTLGWIKFQLLQRGMSLETVDALFNAVIVLNDTTGYSYHQIADFLERNALQ